jgi:nucleoside-diphosphate-sugar epimerase
MRAFVSGGSGFVGGHLIERLVRDGHDVVALARSADAAETVSGFGATPVPGDLHADLVQHLRGVDRVFHAAAVVGSAGDRAAMRRVNVEGTARLVDAAVAADVGRFVLVSTESVLLDGRSLDTVDETTPVPTDGHLSPYAATKAAAERLVLAERRIDTVAVRPRFVWGPRDSTWLPGLVAKVEAGVFRWVDGGRHLGSTCHVFNLVEALVLAAERGEPGEAYFVTDGPPLSFREFATAYLGTVGVHPGDASAPGWLLGGVAATVEALWRLLPGDPPLNRVEVNMVGHPMVIDDGKARRDLGYRPVISIEDGMAALAG